MSKNLYNFYIMAFIIKNTKLPLIIFPVFTVNTKKNRSTVFTLLQKKINIFFHIENEKKINETLQQKRERSKTRETRPDERFGRCDRSS